VTSGGGSWVVERQRGPAVEFHGRPLPAPARRAVWVFDVERPAVALGSAQPAGHIDEREAAARGVEVVRRRSGGGAVLLLPGDPLWVDLILPRADPLWDDDVGRAAWWVGETWSAALRAIGVTSAGLAVHRGPMVRTEWSDRVCFAGRGAGEVGSAGRKIVGISQRRTRDVARFQCAVPLRWRPETLVALLDLPGVVRSRCRVAVSAAAVGVADALDATGGAAGGGGAYSLGTDLVALRDRLLAAFLDALPR
jgi:lipoate-protein ligase A